MITSYQTWNKLVISKLMNIRNNWIQSKKIIFFPVKILMTWQVAFIKNNYNI